MGYGIVVMGNEKSLSDLWFNIKYSKTCWTGAPGEDEKNIRQKKIIDNGWEFFKLTNKK